MDLSKENENELFLNLKKPATLSLNKGEVFKRLRIDFNMITELNKSEELCKELFDGIQEEMEGLGCPSFTFYSPDGELTLLKYSKFNKYCELRAVGLKRKR